jgi:hypothetical protein
MTEYGISTKNKYVCIFTFDAFLAIIDLILYFRFSFLEEDASDPEEVLAKAKEEIKKEKDAPKKPTPAVSAPVKPSPVVAAKSETQVDSKKRDANGPPPNRGQGNYRGAGQGQGGQRRGPPQNSKI